MMLSSLSESSGSVIRRQNVFYASPDSIRSGRDSDGARLVRESSPWLRFTWQLDKVPAFPSGSLKEEIRPAKREEGEDVLGVLLLSLSMDSSWNDSLAKVENYLRASVARLFNEEVPMCFVIQKGNRLVAASLLDPEPASGIHLVSGPAVLSEYRNRGLGTNLLSHSLSALAGKGLVSATGITRTNTTAALHVYPKFGGVCESVQFSSEA